MAALQTFKDLNRLRHIIDVFLKHGFGYLITETGLHLHLPFHKKLKSRFQKVSSNNVMAVQLRHTFEELGGTFIKLGQLLSLRPDLVPKEFCNEFKELQDAVPPFPFEQAKKIIETELKKPLNKVFSKFDKKPVASASMAQVYKAVLKRNKKTVAVKVQRPTIREIMKEDIDLMHYIAKLLKKTNKFGIDPIQVVDEFKRYTERELNFKSEALNAEKLRKNLSSLKTTKIPKMYFDYTTSKVLVMDFVSGISAANMEQIKEKYPNREKFIKNAIDSIFKQVLLDGFFHADSHPANIIFLKDQKIAFIDFGIIGTIKKSERLKILLTLKNMYEGNKEAACSSILSFCDIKNATDMKGFKEEASKEMSQVAESNHLLGEAGPGKAIFNIINIASNYKIKVPIDIVLFAKAFFTMEGTIFNLDPTVALMDEVKKRVKKHFGKKLYIGEFMHKSEETVKDIVEFVTKLPEHAEKILEHLEEKKQDNSEKIVKLQNQVTNLHEKIVIGIIIIAFLLGFTLFSLYGNIKMVMGMPLPFMIFLLAVIFGIIYSIFSLNLRNKNI